MQRFPGLRLLALLVSLGLTACAAYQAQHSRGTGSGSTGAEPAAPSAAPSAEFTELSTAAQLARVRGEVEETKSRLAAEGKYACCVEPACNECLLRHGECHCRDEVREHGPCCGECTESWMEGKGVVEGVSAWELLERKKQQLRDQEKEGEGQEEPPHGHHRH